MLSDDAKASPSYTVVRQRPTMRASPILLLAILLALPSCLPAAQQQHSKYQIVLKSSDLPERDRQDILKSIDVSVCPYEMVRDIVRNKVRDLGYGQSEVEEQRQETGDHIQLTENIKAGVRYRLRSINVVQSTVFPADQLRREVPIASGDVLSSASLYKGVDQIRDLYASRGYIDTVITPIPKFDSQKGVADLTLEVDEGLPYRLGALLLNGVEPYPGAAKQLIDSWKPMRGQLFKPSMIDKWLQANKTICPSRTWRDLLYRERRISSSSNLVDVTLALPPYPRCESLPSSKTLLPESRAK